MKKRQIVQRWRALPAGWFKCNTDGAFYPDQGQGVSGVLSEMMQVSLLVDR